ncbi:hypothetical protein [Burkholderia multivorans]|uniref:hypothetical protein n=1 Tax=Burkholderia multivorans TaxID=87883 RepID=UPI0020192899|nr:hypothetical protein [Burkholderia multivorans]MCO1384485.1 hypothetical protein [Burkholderia multivorans]MCO1399877.1 hypothetical protein [Burkholderia multivorans]UQO81064.1 hypothetical protein L0Z12_21715 [Burkholderia multivorans]
MTTLNVQFSDSSETTIIVYFASPQSMSAYTNLGTVEASDARWAAFYQSMDSQARQYLPPPTSD